MKLKRQAQAKTLRDFRKIHRITGVLLFAFFFIVGLSGILLGWKKNSGGLIMAESYKGQSVKLDEWISLDSLHKNACSYLKDSVSPSLSAEVDRIDIRKDKGMVKFTFKDHFTGLQLDGKSGKLLFIEQRRADYIEKIHDGSIVDYYLGWDGYFKLFYTLIMGLALIIFTITGFWLWYGPKMMRNK